MSFQPARLETNWATKVELGKGLHTMSAAPIPPLTIDLPQGDFDSFNNSILFWRGKVLMSYRVWDHHSNNIFITELDDKFSVKGKSRLLIENAEDGRLCILNGGLYCAYSSHCHLSSPSPRCHMHICKLDDDLNVAFDKHLVPIKKCEKNWVFFSRNGEIFCIYDYQPALTVWRMDENFEVVDIITKKPIVWEFGEVRGGTTPILIDGNFMSIVHSTTSRVYVNAILQMTKNFDVFSIQRINIDNSAIVFPCGFAERNGRYFVSYGVEDRFCRIRELLMWLA